MSTKQRLGDLQLAIMRVLWSAGEQSVTDVRDALAERRLAQTTVATMLKKLEKKGVVDHRLDGRRFLYRPQVSEEEVRRSMVAGLTDQLFRGDVGALVSHLLNEHETDPDEVERLRRIIRASASSEEGDGR
jgi:predicted transcriptional regulator